jgi:hypothetical protein
MEYLITAVILYFVLQTAGNLVYILRGGGAKPSSGESASPPDGWGGPSPRQHTEGITNHPTFWGEDIEDATWRDLKE